MKLNERLKKLRNARGITTRALSEMTGINIANLSRIESGKNSPTLETTEKICKALGARIIILDDKDDNNDDDAQRDAGGNNK